TMKRAQVRTAAERGCFLMIAFYSSLTCNDSSPAKLKIYPRRRRVNAPWILAFDSNQLVVHGPLRPSRRPGDREFSMRDLMMSSARASRHHRTRSGPLQRMSCDTVRDDGLP